MKRTPQEISESVYGISRRTLIVGAFQFGIIGALGLRMHSLQVRQAEEFRLLADENRINMRLIPPARGLIFDRNGILLAGNAQTYRIVMIREDAGDVQEVLNRLTRLIPLSPKVVERAIQEMRRRPAFVPVTVADRVRWEDMAKVSVNTPALPGVIAEVGLSRHYPFGADLAHVVGYVGPADKDDLSRIDDQDPVLQIPRFPVGKIGIEKKLERQLRGTAGSKRIEVNAIGRVMQELDRQDSIPGTDLQLTIDARLQSYVQARLEGQAAAAVVIGAQGGDLRAIGSSPSFDPNLFVRGISLEDWNRLRNDAYRPLAAKAIQGLYPPGSIFKLITALAALEMGAITPEETVFCKGHTDVSGIRFHCWKRDGHGNVNLHESLKQSCDSYYYDISRRVGIENIAQMARRLGLGIQHDLPLSAIADGLIPDQDWKLAFRDEPWRIGDTINASIGQGFVLASPLQLAIMTARIATGRQVLPRLIHSIGGIVAPSKPDAPLGINENSLRRIRLAMDAVTNHQRGTAFRSRIIEPEMKLAGKTGTSQVRRITAQERLLGITENKDLPWRRRDHALFSCFAPIAKPRFAVVVVVEHGGSGSATAAPIARDIILQALYDGPPPLSVYPSEIRGRIAEQQQRIGVRTPPGGSGSARA